MTLSSVIERSFAFARFSNILIPSIKSEPNRTTASYPGEAR